VINDANILYPLSNYIAGGYYTLYAALYENNSGVIEVKQCYADTATNLVFTNLQIGREYYIKMMYRQVHFFTDYEFQVSISNPAAMAVSENIARQTAVYPNPVKDLLNIKMGESGEIKSLEIYTILGQSIMKVDVKDEVGIDVSAFSAGTYLIRTFGVNGYGYTRFIKE
jgi:hypothetical protein